LFNKLIILNKNKKEVNSIMDNFFICIFIVFIIYSGWYIARNLTSLPKNEKEKKN